MPFPVFDSDTLSKLYPSDLVLKQVTLIHRHGYFSTRLIKLGERTPIYPSNYPFLTDNLWKRCHIRPELHALYSAAEVSKPYYGNYSCVFHGLVFNDPQYETPHLFSKVISQGHDQRTPLFKAIEQLQKIQGDGLCFYGRILS
jgi:hypothetical protein